MSEKTICVPLKILVFCFISALLPASGCGTDKSALIEAELERMAMTEKIELAEKAGGLVLVVGGETITSDEVIGASADMYDEEDKTVAELLRPMARQTDAEKFKELASKPVRDVAMGRISGILLYQHAKRQIAGNMDEALDKMAEKELRKFVLKHGGDQAKADQELKKMGMDRESFKEDHKKLIITQSYMASKLPLKKPVTYGELAAYYESNKEELFFIPATVKFRLIDIEIGKMEVTELDQNKLAEARRLGLELGVRIRAGEDFAELAKEYSHGHRRVFGGLWPEVQPESLIEPYDILAEKADQIEPGQVVGPIEKVGHVFIMKLEEKQDKGYEPLEKVQAEVNGRILRGRENEAIRRLNDRLLREAAIGETDEFVDFCLDKIFRMSNEEEDVAL